MKYYKNLNIKGAVLDKCQLEQYIEKVAENQNIVLKSNKKTYPVIDLKENFKFIYETYAILNEHLKLGISIHSAGEWLLDNFYLIEETVKSIEKDMPIKRYKMLNGIGDGKYKGYARVYVLASEIVGYTDSKVTEELVLSSINSYQRKKLLTIEELRVLPIFLKISMIQNIAECCEKIYVSQIQKYKVEEIVSRLVENKEDIEYRKNRFKINIKNRFDYSDLKNSFVEYMSYKLKKIGNIGNPYADVLEEQVRFTGTTTQEIIMKEHFHIATIKTSIGNSITSIKNINRINFKELLENSNKVEEILNNDPSGDFKNMTQDTKEMYLEKITEISKKTKISEVYIANQILSMASIYKFENKDNLKEYRKSHVGYYIIDEGEKELLSILRGKKVRKVSMYEKSIIFIRSVFFIPLLLDIILTMAFFSKAHLYNVFAIALYVIFFLAFWIILSEIYIKIVMYISSKIAKPKKLAKINLNNKVPKELATFVVIPTIINSKKKIDELVRKIEVYYHANKSKNLYFAILGDCTSSDHEKEKMDDEIASYGKEKILELNKKYYCNYNYNYNLNFDASTTSNTNDNNSSILDEKNNGKNNISNEAQKTNNQNNNKNDNPNNIFYFLYRKRKWNPSEKLFLGWERKRGLLNQFHEYLLNKNNCDFIVNTLEENNFNKKIKYIITLDSDTDLVLNSAFQMIGAMSHILNRPVVENRKVINGYGIMQPKVGTNLKDSIRSKFCRIFSENVGTNLYENASYDFYQDLFGEAIFCGKGIYDLNVYNEILAGEINENTVLSHDLLEGSYLRCGLLSDVTLLDSYPYKFSSYLERENRWIRGDWQLIRWLKKKNTSLNFISKYKIFDNLRRSTLSIVQLIILFLSFIVNSPMLLIIDLISIFMPTITGIIDKVLFRKTQDLNIINAYKNFEVDYSGLKGTFIKDSFNILFLPSFAFSSSKAIIKTIYRLIKKEKLLEWTTSEEVEKRKDGTIEKYYELMSFNLISGIVLFGFLNPFSELLGTLWLFAPLIAWSVSIDEKDKKLIYNMNSNKLKDKNKSEEDEKYLLEIGNKTWNYFSDYMNESTSFLPPDNYQLDRKEKIVYRTSSTNIGLGILSVISAYDLKYIDLKRAMFLIENILNTIMNLEKWNGHLYNWYNIKTLEPCSPRYVSTVDSGNFVGYLYVLKSFLVEIEAKICDKATGADEVYRNDLADKNNIADYNEEKLTNMIQKVDNLIKNTDFSLLYSKKNKLLSIGYDAEKMKLTDSYYDFLASEARQASLIAIAKKDVDEKLWSNLSRTLTTLDGYKGLISWSGTAFEYLMPNINIKSYPGSLLDESCKFMIMSQIKYALKNNIPWGISEAAYDVKDLNSNYQYKAFGVPWLGLKRGLEEELVVSSYSTFLSMEFSLKESLKNLKRLESLGMVGKYGFYESIDYTKFRMPKGKKHEIVKTYMAHHQGLILTSINNVLNNEILKERFFKNPEIESVDILLQEKMPNSIMISKNINGKLKKQKYINEYYDKEIIYKENNINNDNDSDSVNINFYEGRSYVYDYKFEKNASKGKYSKYKYDNYNSNLENNKNINLQFKRVNTISNGDYLLEMDNNGQGYSKYKDIQINRYFINNNYYNPNGFYIKNVKNNNIIRTDKIKEYNDVEVKFSQGKNEYDFEKDGIEVEHKITILVDGSGEMRRLTLRNLGLIDATLEITFALEVILSSALQDIAHPVFNNMFLNIEYLEENEIFIIQRKDRNEENSKYYLAIKLYFDLDSDSDLDSNLNSNSNSDLNSKIKFEIDKEKFIGRKNIGVPDMVINSQKFENEVKDVVEPIIAINKQIKLKKDKATNIDAIISIDENKENVIEKLMEYESVEKRNEEFKLSKAKSEEEIKYLQINGDYIETYQKLYGHIKYNDIQKDEEILKKAISNNYLINDLWKYGISGDNPILLIRIENIEDIDVIKEIIKAFEFYIVKNISLDLCILNGEENSYELVLKELINDAIRDNQLEYMINNKIFILDEYAMEQKDIELLYCKSALAINIKYGNLKLNLQEIENIEINKKYKENKNQSKIRNRNQDKDKDGNKENDKKLSKQIFESNKNLKTCILEKENRNYSDMVNDSLLFFNGTGGFSKDGKEYIFKSDMENEVPMPWVNVLSNENFGTVITDNFGGFTWNKNSRLNRITNWNNEPSIDLPSEIIYIKDVISNKYWSFCSRISNNNDYVIKHGLGYSEFTEVCDDLLQTATIFVDKKEARKNIILNLKNLKDEKRKIKLYYYINCILGEDIYKTDNNVIRIINKNEITNEVEVTFVNLFKNQFDDNVIIKLNKEAKINRVYTKNDFFGNDINLSFPSRIINNRNDSNGNSNSYNNHNCLNNNDNYFKSNSILKTNSAVIEIDIEIDSFESKEILLKLECENCGNVEKALKDNFLIENNNNVKRNDENNEINKEDEYTGLEKAKNDLEEARKYWNGMLSKLQINTPSKELDIFINSWCMYQTIASRLFGKTAYYQSGGAIGYRDQLQDMFSLKYIDTEYMRNHILKCAKHQFKEGDVLHWWHESNNLGVRTRFSDDFLWLVYSVLEYIDFTNDYGILEEKIPYINDEKLKAEENERCKIYDKFDNEQTLLEHCIKAVERGINFGRNNLLKIGSGDWNDGFSLIGSKGSGESIWLGFFLYDILKRFEAVLEHLGKLELCKRYKIIMYVLKKALNDVGWEEQNYIRAITDDGSVIGSFRNEECKIDSISQSWSVISEAGDNDKKYIAMESVNKYLVDKDEKIIKLLTPAFSGKEYDPGYISKYKNGIRENGGQYTHGAVWNIIAFAKLGLNEKAYEMVEMLNPINHSNTKLAIKKYKGEPYVLAGDVYSNKDMIGRAGWSWYTGGASWYYKAVIENILGLQILENKLYINPHIPKEWNEFSIRYLYKKSIYKIIVKNINKNVDKITTFKVNGKPQENKYLKLESKDKEVVIEIEM